MGFGLTPDMVSDIFSMAYGARRDATAQQRQDMMDKLAMLQFIVDTARDERQFEAEEFRFTKGLDADIKSREDAQRHSLELERMRQQANIDEENRQRQLEKAAPDIRIFGDQLVDINNAKYQDGVLLDMAGRPVTADSSRLFNMYNDNIQQIEMAVRAESARLAPDLFIPDGQGSFTIDLTKENAPQRVAALRQKILSDKSPGSLGYRYDENVRRLVGTGVGANASPPAPAPAPASTPAPTPTPTPKPVPPPTDIQAVPYEDPKDRPAPSGTKRPLTKEDVEYIKSLGLTVEEIEARAKAANLTLPEYIDRFKARRKK